jgi:hypothetical protein
MRCSSGRRLALECVGLFGLGAVYDAGCLVWIHFADQHRSWPAALVAMALTASGLLGYDGALGEGPGRWARSASLVLGYGVGTFVAIWIKDWI